jgi:transposase
MPGKNNTDSLDARGLAILLRNGTLPEVWIPPAKLLDLRGLLRARLSLRQKTTQLKNRIHAALARYGVRPEKSCRDLFCGKRRVQLSVSVGQLPLETRLAALHEWDLLDQMEVHIQELEQRIRERIGPIGWVRLLRTQPGSE